MHIWLDDVRDPTNPEIQELFGATGNEVWCKTVYQAVQHIATGNVESISFDHDLQDRKTGYDLAKWIERKAAGGYVKRMVWHIHSQNAAGANNIRRAMTNADKYWEQNG